jgi:NAD(P)-dependent dehydrogenase (short-subunit alcohol dehydrogenase family)
MEIANASILIVGGSRGLGFALGKALASEGASVVLVARHADELQAAVGEIRAAGGKAYGIVADIGRKESIYRISGQSVALAGPIDILILCSSTLGPTPLRMLLDTECEDLEQVLQVNLIGPFRLAKALGGSMGLRDHGLVLSISSDAAVEAYVGWGAYGVSKAALDHLTRIFGAEMEGTAVRFLSLDPGEMNTRMHAEALPDSDTSSLAQPEDVAKRVREVIRHADQYPNGARLIAANVEVS